MTNTTRVLVTGFEPFGGSSINASLEAVRRLPLRIAGLEVNVAELPTSFARSLNALECAIDNIQPAIVLCVGQASERGALCIERIAINVQDAHRADNDGARPVDTPIVQNGPAAYFSTLPVKDIAQALVAANLPAEESNSAGTFVCNHVFYGLMHLTATKHKKLRAGLLHVPCLPEPSTQPSDKGTPMALADIVRGIRIALETTAANVERIISAQRRL